MALGKLQFWWRKHFPRKSDETLIRRLKLKAAKRNRNSVRVGSKTKGGKILKNDLSTYVVFIQRRKVFQPDNFLVIDFY